MFAGVNMFLARLRLILARAAGEVKMSSEKGQKHIYAKKLNSITIIIISEGIEKRNH